MFPWLKDDWLKLRKMYTAGTGPQALLIAGPDGIGKKELARELAQLLLCQNINLNGYCGSCQSCLLAESGNHPDMLVVQSAGKKIPIADARMIKEMVALSPRLGFGRAIIIEDADMMTVEASNAILKILEEPPKGNVFILTSDNPDAMLPTVAGRCVRLTVKSPSYADAWGWMSSELGKQSSEMHEGIYSMCGRSPIAAVGYVKNGMHPLVCTLAREILFFIDDRRRTSFVQDAAKIIASKLKELRAEKLEAQAEASDSKKPAKQSSRVSIEDVHDYLYCIIADAMRYLNTGIAEHNSVLRADKAAKQLAKVGAKRLDAAIEGLKAMRLRERAMPSASFLTELSVWLNALAGVQ